MSGLDLNSIFPGLSREEQMDRVLARAREMADGGNPYDAGRLLQLVVTEGQHVPVKKSGREAHMAWQAALYYEAAGRPDQAWALASVGESGVDRHTYLDYMCKLLSLQTQTPEIGQSWAETANTLRNEFPESPRGWRWFLLWGFSIGRTDVVGLDFVKMYVEPALALDPNDHELRIRAARYLRGLPGGSRLADTLEAAGMGRTS